MGNPPAIDLLSAASFSNGQPHDQFRWLRRNAPVYRHPEPHGPGFWAITRYNDVRAVGRDPGLFSSCMGGVQIADIAESFQFAPPPMGDVARALSARTCSVKSLSAQILRKQIGYLQIVQIREWEVSVAMDAG